MDKSRRDRTIILLVTVSIAIVMLVISVSIVFFNKKHRYNSIILRAEQMIEKESYEDAIRLYNEAKEYNKDQSLINNSIELCEKLKVEKEEKIRQEQEARELEIKQREEQRKKDEEQLRKEQEESEKQEEEKEKPGFFEGIGKFIKSLFGN